MNKIIKALEFVKKEKYDAKKELYQENDAVFFIYITLYYSSAADINFLKGFSF